MLRYLIILLMLVIINQNASAGPLCGAIEKKVYTSSPCKLQHQKAKYDPKGKLLKGSAQKSKFFGLIHQQRGYLGCLFNPYTGEIYYIFPNSDLTRNGIKAGDQFVLIKGQIYRPCLMPSVSTYYSDSFVELLIRRNNKLLNVRVKLMEPRSMPGFLEWNQSPSKGNFVEN
jgi:hypothetical protein